ncbi:DegT/DnrJ/EryC1/StrS family aminotransferase [Aequorivita xiaoshiensis]|uniref:DegT/DnrJ/EryC1/StrS family aminotransferase n=1 Tax=Aequorivita xiaoshiensis TaxID=2874476 RepID=A0A9X1R2S4_9FLAO|nr:DegT/DnrJ/EryC1/StrS family aminotransferase [Aequorivita xiaoshiensis]MCG2431665.1 DegT/DnrJ/EryC1/StrS family aminotransferase [Aequorivita xiaoshiensis]
MDKIFVTKPFLAPRKEYDAYVSKIWDNQWLTNMGPLAVELENKLCEHLKVENLLYVSNGTIALHMAIKALDLKGEIITTPFSFVATTNSIVWEGCTPVFVDINADNLNINPAKIEEAITDKTTTILSTHIFGNPCDVEAIQKIADKHNLKVIYDAAHAFGVKLNGKSIFEFGDISTCSLHATKFYHTGEGGLVIAKDKEVHKKLGYIRNHGLHEKEGFASIGTNAKNSEFHAALGLVNLNYVGEILEKRQQIAAIYKLKLQDNVKFQTWNTDASNNYCYFPVIFKTEQELLRVKEHLEQNNIFTRRYFYPSLASSLPYLPTIHLPISEDISKRCLCLPIYFDLSLKDTVRICDLILATI